MSRDEQVAAQMPDPGSFGGHPYTPEERRLGYGTDHDPRIRLYKETVTKTAIPPITKKEPRDAGTSGATT